MLTENSNNPLTLVVFGATGDLYQNKLATSLFHLFIKGFLPDDFHILGFARKPLSDLEFQNLTRDAILNKNKASGEQDLKNFLSHVRYIKGDLENLESFKNLSIELGKKDAENKVCSNKLFYLAVPPTLYRTIFKNISEAGLTVPCAPDIEYGQEKWTRVLVEKPFGKDIEDAKKLDQMLGQLFDESQIFRIDHYLAYLAKGVVEKILNFRFGNGLSESKWGKENIEKVRIVFHEKDLVEKRGDFFDSLGALRDVGQNHMLQMLALVAMENPLDIQVGGLHKARQKVLEKLKISEAPPENKIVRGQYAGYLEEMGVNPDSETETFFRVVLSVDNTEWQDVPFILEFGKALDKSEVFIEVCFKETKTCIDFPVSNEETLRDAYDKVFYDCILGDQTIFVSTGEVMAEWKIITDIIQKWKDIPLVIYKKSSKGGEVN